MVDVVSSADSLNVILNIIQTGSTVTCLTVGIWWFNNRDKTREKEREEERAKYFTSMADTTNTYREEARECRMAAAKREEEFRQFIQQQEERHRVQIEDILDRHQTVTQSLESRVYESLVTQRAMSVQIEQKLGGPHASKPQF